MKDYNKESIDDSRWRIHDGQKKPNNQPPNFGGWLLGIAITISALCAYGYSVENCSGLSSGQCAQQAVRDFLK